jgi:hypothetical protein
MPPASSLPRNSPVSFATYVSAVVTGFPSRLRPATPLPGERLLQVAIRTNPRLWKACVEELAAAHALSSAGQKRLLAGDLAAITPAMQPQVERWANTAMPTHFRTLDGLARLRDALRSDGSCHIQEIVWFREDPPPGPAEAKADAARASAETLGVKVVALPHGSPPAMDLAQVYPHVNGQVIWFVPGGTLPPTGRERLRAPVCQLTVSGKHGIYSDNVASFLLLASCGLREDAFHKVPLPIDPAHLARVLKPKGYDFVVAEPGETLCDLEPEFGGWSKPAPAARRWWERLFGG